MAQHDWTLRLSLVGPYGEHYATALAIGGTIMREIAQLAPPDVLLDFKPNDHNPMMTAVTIMRRREFRKDLFTAECARLGAMLAEHMEDREGWHGPDRADRLKDLGK